MSDQRRVSTGRGQQCALCWWLSGDKKRTSLLHPVSVLTESCDEGAQQTRSTEHGGISSGGGKTRSRKRVVICFSPACIMLKEFEGRGKLFGEAKRREVEAITQE